MLKGQTYFKMFIYIKKFLNVDKFCHFINRRSRSRLNNGATPAPAPQYLKTEPYLCLIQNLNFRYGSASLVLVKKSILGPTQRR